MKCTDVAISYSIMCHEEDESLDKLISKLIKHKLDKDEIVILYDEGANPKTEDVLKKYALFINLHRFKFDGHFANAKNKLKSLCSKDYEFNIDADEYPHDFLLENIHCILQNNKIDVYWLPRINIVDGIRSEYITMWGWHLNEKGWINFPDYQMRISNLKNPDIKWYNKVHEVQKGFTNYAYLDAFEEYCLYHIKSFEKQLKQNTLYDKLMGQE